MEESKQARAAADAMTVSVAAAIEERGVGVAAVVVAATSEASAASAASVAASLASVAATAAKARATGRVAPAVCSRLSRRRS